jgi:hypothetical protein
MPLTTAQHVKDHGRINPQIEDSDLDPFMGEASRVLTARFDDYPSLESAAEQSGGWDPAMNSPALADGTGTAGYWYLISEDAERDLGGGVISWTKGNHVYYDGTRWLERDGARLDDLRMAETYLAIAAALVPLGTRVDVNGGFIKALNQQSNSQTQNLAGTDEILKMVEHYNERALSLYEPHLTRDVDTSDDSIIDLGEIGFIAI